MTGIKSVELVDRWVFDDFRRSAFDDRDQRELLEDIDQMEKNIKTWGRELTDCVDMLSGTSETIYRRRQGDLRSYFVRDGDTLYCIGVGKRKTTYDRDLDQIDRRARHFR